MSNSSRLMGGLMEASTSGSSSSGSRTPPSPPRRSTEGGGTAGQQARGRLLPPSEKARLELMQAVESYWPLFVVVWLGLCTCGPPSKTRCSPFGYPFEPQPEMLHPGALSLHVWRVDHDACAHR
jgi:hypothetical protein